jgi:hypothetical protein
MTGLPSVKPARLIAALGRAGFFVHHATGGHYVLKHHARRNCGWWCRIMRATRSAACFGRSSAKRT